MIWVAYSHAGDLITTADSEGELWRKLDAMGWYSDEVYAGRITP